MANQQNRPDISLPEEELLEEEISRDPTLLNIASDPEIDGETVKAAQYLYLRQVGKSKKVIAEEYFRVAERTIYNWVRNWEKDGTLDRAKTHVLQPALEETQKAQAELMQRWPHFLRRLMNIVEYSRSDRNAIEAFDRLKIEYQEVSAQLAQAGQAESEYAKRKIDSQPNVIQVPAFIKKAKAEKGQETGDADPQ